MDTKKVIELADLLANDIMESASKKEIDPRELPVIIALAHQLVQRSVCYDPISMILLMQEADTIFREMVEVH